MNIIKKVPVPICSVMLGFAALGNLLQSCSEGLRWVCGIVAGLLLTLVLLKLALYPQMIREDMKNPILASVSGTFPMALMLLSVYVKPLIGRSAMVLWILAVGLHVALIIYFTMAFMRKLQLAQVFASYYIVYVGIAVAAVTAPAYEMQTVDSIVFRFGFVTFIALLVLVTKRYITLKNVPEPARPLFCIYAAPLSLCVAGYVQSVTPKSARFLLAMLGVATVLYLISLVKAIGFLNQKFQLRCIYVPVCHQCDCYEADTGMSG